MPQYEPIIPEGQRLGNSHDHDGAVTGHLFDQDNKLQGHAAWKLIDEPEDEYSPSHNDGPTRELTPEEQELIEQITVLVLTLLVLGIQTAAPRVRKWWSNTALPTVKRAWLLVTRRKAPPELKTETVELLQVVEAAIENAPEPGSQLLLAEPEFTMSSAEWAERYKAMVAAARFRDEQADLLRRAKIVNETPPLTADTRFELTPREFAARVRRMLTSHPELLTEETTVELQRMLEKQMTKRRDESDDGHSL